MLNIGFELEDPSLCEGCPFDIKKATKCKGGFTREYMKVWETGEKCQAFAQGPGGFFYPVPDADHEAEAKSSWVRPQSCIVVAEVKPKFGGTLSRNMTIFNTDFLKKPKGKGTESEEK